MAAREILVLGKTATIPPNSNNAEQSFPPAERLALGRKLLTEAVRLLDAPHKRTYNYAYRNYRIEIAKGYVFLGDFTKVSSLIKQETSPEWKGRAWAEIGKFQVERGEKTAAKQSLKQAISSLQAFSGSDSDRADIQRHIVELAALLSDVVTVQEQYKQMYVKGAPQGHIPHEKYQAIPALAFALAGAGRLDEANKRVLEIPTTHILFRVEAYTRMSHNLRQRGRLSEAVQCAEKGWQTASKILDPTAKSEAWTQVGEAFGMVGYRKRARLAYKQAVSDLAGVREVSSWYISQNGKATTGVYTEAKPRFAMRALESQARINDTDEAVKLLPRISAPDDESLKAHVYGYQARAWLALARSYAEQGRAEEAISALTRSRDAMSKTEYPNLEVELMQMRAVRR